MTLVKSYNITMYPGTLVGSSSIKYYGTHLAKNNSMRRGGTTQDGYIIKSISIDSYISKKIHVPY